MLDEDEFLSAYGIGALSRAHYEIPLPAAGRWQRVYGPVTSPRISTTGLFGGNSNWRGPIWFPVNFLLIESLQKFHQYYGDNLKMEYPTGSGLWLNLEDIAARLATRLTGLFLKDATRRAPDLRQQPPLLAKTSISRT